MRVITGSAKGKRLKTLDGLDVRPTSEKVKESIFSIIQFELENAKFLDLFAGSGQIGIEALSRGAQMCVFVDNNRDSQKIIKENLQNTALFSKSRVVNMDSLSYLQNCSDVFDIAFLDPPYNLGILQKALPKIVEKMQKSGIIICEHEKNDILPNEVGDFCVFRTYSYGRINLTTYRKKED
jgi:16S rRNA (guanine(966)-N(2))-methyltransferase RsmD